MEQQYIHIGKVVSSHGIKGECIVKHSLSAGGGVENLKMMYIEKQKDTLIPYFIESVSVKNEEELLVKFEGVETPEQAKLLSKKNLWLTEKQFLPFRHSAPAISLLGYQLISATDNKNLGEILEVIEQPHQVLCRIEVSGKEAYVPLHEKNLRTIDRKSGKVYVDIPEGLMDVYLK